MTDMPNPWIRPPEAPRPPQAPQASPWIRGFAWLCAASIVFGAPVQIADDLSLLLTRKPAVARVLAPDDPGGAPAPLVFSAPLPPWSRQIERVALRFTTDDGREVTAAVAALPPSSYWLATGTEVPIRYDPRDPANGVVVRTTWMIWLRLVGTLLFGWLLLGWSVRVGRGASPYAHRTTWPPWSFAR